MSDEQSVEKMRKYVTIKNNTMSPFKKRLLKRNGKASHFDIEEIQSLHEANRKPVVANLSPTRSSSTIFQKKTSTQPLSSDIDSIVLHNRKEAAASYQFKEKLNVILGEKIKGQSKKGMEYFEMKGDTGEDSDDENDESYADSSFSSENKGEKQEILELLALTNQIKTASLKTMALTILRVRVTKTLAFMSQILSQNLSTLHNKQPI